MPPDGCSGHLLTLPVGTDGAPACRQAWSGEVVINEVVLKPAGRDLDGDGLSNGRDELLELVIIADESVHLASAELRWDGKRRGRIGASPCLLPGEAALLVGSMTGPVVPPAGAALLRLDRTLRLTDGGGHVALYSESGGELGAVVLAGAANATDGCVTREVDGDRWADMVAHAALEGAQGAPWSPGLCAGGGRFPACLQATMERGHARSAPPASESPARGR